MKLEFKKLSAENIEGLSKYYGKRHDQTCDSVILDNFLWADYYHVHYAIDEYFRKAVRGAPCVRHGGYAGMLRYAGGAF